MALGKGNDFEVWSEELGYDVVGEPGSMIGEPVGAPDLDNPLDDPLMRASVDDILENTPMRNLLPLEHMVFLGLSATGGESPDAYDGTSGREKLIEEYVWHANIAGQPSNPDYDQGFDILNELSFKYGIKNVLVHLLTKDLDTQQLVRISGFVGVFVRKGTEPKSV